MRIFGGFSLRNKAPLKVLSGYLSMWPCAKVHWGWN